MACNRHRKRGWDVGLGRIRQNGGAITNSGESAYIILCVSVLLDTASFFEFQARHRKQKCILHFTGFLCCVKKKKGVVKENLARRKTYSLTDLGNSGVFHGKVSLAFDLVIRHIGQCTNQQFSLSTSSQFSLSIS